jgi:radical SAM family uncharacterized protein
MSRVSRTDLWPRVEPLVAKVTRPSRYIDCEFGATHKDDADWRAVLIYPDTYELGQANQGLAILYRCLNETDGVACERAYVPWTDMSALMREAGVPLFSLEGCAPVASFDMVGITLPHELCYTNVLETLDLAGIPLHASERGDGDPLVVGGGPCSYNPEPLAPFFDVFSIGEGEEALPELACTCRRLRDAGVSRQETLREIAHLPGFYVPSLYDMDEKTGAVAPRDPDVPAVVKKRVVADFGSTSPTSQTIVPYAEVAHDRYAIEVLRGCARGCRFCQAGMVYRPVRERTADQVVGAVTQALDCTGYDEVSLTSLSTTDHSQLPEILRRLNRRLEGTATSVSIPSQRVDAFGIEMALLVAGEKKAGLTLAPEAGTQRLRDVINKGVTEDDLMRAVTAAVEAGWNTIKLYFMLGLPYETDDDIRGIGDLVGRVSAAVRDAAGSERAGGIRINVSCAVFVPKPDTPFQWCGQVPVDEVLRRQRVLRESMPKRGVKLAWHDADASFVEAAMARGDRRLARVIEEAWRAGQRFDAWTENFSFDTWTEAADRMGVDLSRYACGEFEHGAPLPWGHISAGVSEKYLEREWRRAGEAQRTADCTFTSCSGCGVCPSLEVENDIKGVRDA